MKNPCETSQRMREAQPRVGEKRPLRQRNDITLEDDCLDILKGDSETLVPLCGLNEMKIQKLEAENTAAINNSNIQTALPAQEDK